jgi:hypothetical protein
MLAAGVSGGGGGGERASSACAQHRFEKFEWSRSTSGAFPPARESGPRAVVSSRLVMPPTLSPMTVGSVGSKHFCLPAVHTMYLVYTFTRSTRSFLPPHAHHADRPHARLCRGQRPLACQRH